MSSKVTRKAAALAAVVLAVIPAGPARPLDRLVFAFAGDDTDLRDRLSGASLLAQTQRDGTTAPQDILAAARAEYGRLEGALYAAGYYSGVIHVLVDGREATEISALNPPRRVGTITVSVQPGPKFRFSRAEIAPVAPDTKLPEEFARGAVAQSGAIKTAAAAAVTGWRTYGHAKADIAGQDIVADHATNLLDARVAVSPGPRVRFGRFTISGNERTRTERVAAIAGFPTGEVFDPDKLDRVATRLRRTGTFKSAALTEADRLGPNDTLDVAAAVLEDKRRRIGFGAEYATDEGFGLSTYYLDRNLLRGAESLRFDAKVSGLAGNSGGIDYSVGVTFNRPATFMPDTDLYVTALAERQDQDDYTSDRAEIGAGLTRYFSEELSAQAGVSLQTERVTDVLGSRNITTFALPVTATWDRRDDKLNATKGFYLAGGVTPFVGINDSGTGGQLKLDARGYKGLGAESRIVLATRVQFGSVLASGILETPRDYLFYSGGGGTVRGQPYQSLGVVSDCAGILGGGAGCTIRTGGRSFLGLSGEVRGRITDKIGVVGFYDAGYIGADSFGGGDVQSGAGLGVRYLTAIGPIRLDVAGPVSGDTGKGVQFYVGIGQAF